MAADWNPFKGKSPEKKDLEAQEAAKAAHEKALEDLNDKRRDLKDQISRVQRRLELKYAEFKKSDKTTKKIVERELRQIKGTLEGLIAKDGVIEKGVRRETATIRQIDQTISMIEQRMVTVDTGMSHDDMAVVAEEYRDELVAEDEAVDAMKVEYGIDESQETEGDIEAELAEFLDISPQSEKTTTSDREQSAEEDDVPTESELRRRLLEELDED